MREFSAVEEGERERRGRNRDEKEKLLIEGSREVFTLKR